MLRNYSIGSRITFLCILLTVGILVTLYMVTYTASLVKEQSLLQSQELMVDGEKAKIRGCPR